jgi:hypothetical protein
MVFFLQAAFADINIDKSRSVYYWFARPQTVGRTGFVASRRGLRPPAAAEPAARSDGPSARSSAANHVGQTSRNPIGLTVHPQTCEENLFEQKPLRSILREHLR